MEGRFGKATVGHIRLQTAPQAAAQAIREAIISGELHGGDRIIEQKWAARLGIGQPTLREALNELTHQGLLRKLPQRGTYVEQLSPEDYRLIQEVRIPLEAIAIGKAAENFTAAADEELTALVASMTGTGMAAGDVKNFHECDVAFHRRIWELAGNDYLRDTLEAVTFRLFVFSVVDRWPGNSKAISERIASVAAPGHSGRSAKPRQAYCPSSIREADRSILEHAVRAGPSRSEVTVSRMGNLGTQGRSSKW